jgi:hypothetical protein
MSTVAVATLAQAVAGVKAVLVVELVAVVESAVVHQTVELATVEHQLSMAQPTHQAVVVP